MPHQRTIEQRLVPVQQSGEIEVLVERAVCAMEVVEDPLLLLREGQNSRRQQAPKAERVALDLREGGALVEAGIVQEIFRTAVATLQGALLLGTDERSMYVGTRRPDQDAETARAVRPLAAPSGWPGRPLQRPRARR
jgi:hypothetical protein